MSASIIRQWNPEDPVFWKRQGEVVARRNLWVSIPALALSFAVWMLWSVVVVHLPAAGFRYSTNQLFWLTALPALCGATLRIFYAFAVPVILAFWALRGRPGARTVMLLLASYFFYMASAKPPEGEISPPWYFAGLLGPEVTGTTLDHETLRGIGSGLGCGAVSLMTGECPVAVAAAVLAYFDRENAGQCGSCFNGTAAMAAAAGALRDGTATADDVARLDRWSVVLRGRGACATLDAATNIAASLLAKFPDDVARHLRGDCPDCGTTVFTAERPFEVAWVEAQ